MVCIACLVATCMILKIYKDRKTVIKNNDHHLTSYGLFLDSILSSPNGNTAMRPSVAAMIVAKCFSLVEKSAAFIYPIMLPMPSVFMLA